MVKKLKSMLIYPRFGWEWDLMHPDVPLGISYIGGLLRKEGFDVKLYDSSFDKSIAEITAAIKEYNPDVIGFEVLSINVENTFIVSKIAKELNKNVLIVAGGPHPNFLPQEMLENEFVDVSVIGEGEATFLDLVQTVEKGGSLSTVKGIAYKDKGNIRINPKRDLLPSLDDLPFPAIDLMPWQKYFEVPAIEPMPAPGINIVTSRGCPFRCKFCQPIAKTLFGGGHRRRSVNNIVDEVEMLIKTYKIKSFTIVDDLFVINDKYVISFCEEMIRRNVKVKWRCNSRVSAVSLDKMKLMKKAGCIAIIFGVESGSQRILNLMNKAIKVEETRRAFKIMKQARLSAMANMLLGYPGENHESIEETIQLIRDIKPEMISINLASPMPGTTLYNQAKAEGRLNVSQYANFNREFPHGIRLDDLNADDLLKYQKKAYVEFYKTIFPRFFIKPYFLKDLIYRMYTLPISESSKMISRYTKQLFKGIGHARR